jgi:hypothetical protein
MNTQPKSRNIAFPLWHLFSAKGAAHIAEPGATPQSSGHDKTSALKAQFTDGQSWKMTLLKRDFGACFTAIRFPEVLPQASNCVAAFGAKQQLPYE